MSHIIRPTGQLLHRLRAHLRQGGIIAYPAEACYGLGCLPRHAIALKRIIALKKRPQHKGLIVVGANWSQLQSLLMPLPASEVQAIQNLWPAPTTLLLPVKPIVPISLRGKSRHTLAVRVPDSALSRFLCRTLGTALVSTSCNRAGKKNCRQEREVLRQFGRQVMVVGGRTGGRKQPSQIINWQSGQRLR